MAKKQEAPIEVVPVVPPKERKFFSLERSKEGWVMMTLTMLDDDVSSITATDPDLKAVAIEKFKIAAFKYWTGAADV